MGKTRLLVAGIATLTSVARLRLHQPSGCFSTDHMGVTHALCRKDKTT